MKVERTLIQICLLFAAMLPVVTKAQDYTYTTNSGTITITGYIGSDNAVIIPDTINDLPVTSIGDYAFPYSANLTNVTIGEGITNIGDYAFSDCTSLTSINVTLFNSYFTSVDGVLFNWSEATLIQYPASKYGSSYTIPNSVINIGSDAFYYSLSLTNVTIPDSVTSIGLEAFYDCVNLTDITIPNSVTNIGPWAFWSCTSLNNMTIPKSVTSIGSFAFLYCVSLEGVYFQGNAPSDGGDVFDSVNNVTIYYLPNTTGWVSTFSGLTPVLWNPQAQTSDGDFGVRTNQLGFNITGTTNIPIVVQACTNLGGAWTPLQSVSLTNGSFYFSDPQWTNYPQRFYRIRSP